jgi:hypothetical protein
MINPIQNNTGNNQNANAIAPPANNGGGQGKGNNSAFENTINQTQGNTPNTGNAGQTDAAAPGGRAHGHHHGGGGQQNNWLETLGLTNPQQLSNDATGANLDTLV